MDNKQTKRYEARMDCKEAGWWGYISCSTIEEAHEWYNENKIALSKYNYKPSNYILIDTQTKDIIEKR